MAIKLAATDLDGTLISTDGLTISRENLDSMKNAVEKGVYIVPTTGRSFYEIPPELREERPYNYCICSNGAVILDRDDREIWKSTFPKELVLKLYEILSKYDTMIEFYAKGRPQTKTEYLARNRIFILMLKRNTMRF